MHKNKRTTMLLFSVLAISAIVAPGMYMNAAKADVTPQQFTDFGNIFSDPSGVGSTIGGMLGGMEGFQGNVLGNIFMLMFDQILNFDEQEMLPGQNVYVFSAAANSSTASTSVNENQTYTTYAPYQDDDGNTYRVKVSRDVDVNVTFKQEAMVVLILWDDDGSLVAAIQKVLAVVKEGIAWAETHNASIEDVPQELIEKAAECITWMLVHINDIITGDEQIIFQPSYYWTYNVTGTMSETHEWRYAKNNTIVVDPTTRSWSPSAMGDDYMNYLKSTPSPFAGSMSDTGFMFHLFQLWLQKFQLSINMSKMGELISYAQANNTVEDDMLGNLLEGVDIKFTFTQHHLIGGALFDDADGNGVPTVDYVTTDIQYNDTSGTKNVTIPTTSELRYKLDIASSGSDWTATEPHRVAEEIKWKVQFNNPTIKATPIGMDDYEAEMAGASETMTLTNMSYGFTFKPAFEDVNVPAADGSIVKTVKLGKGTVKLDQAFGDFDDGFGGGLPVALDGLRLAIVYMSHIFKFDFSYRNEVNPDVSEETEWYNRTDGKLDFLDSSSADYFGQIDIAGPYYETLTNGSTYPASTSIIPIAMLQFTFESERNVANDDFSISQGETAFRTESLYLDVSSAWALYCVAYPMWDGTAILHDPTFSIFMTLESATPWAIILLVVTIGALVGGAILIYIRKQRSS